MASTATPARSEEGRARPLRRLRLGFARTWTGVRRFLGRPKFRRDPDAVFTRFDVDQLKDELDLAHHAHRFGSSGLPSPDSTGLDGPQVRIRTHIRTELGEGFRRTNARVARLWSALGARDVSELLATLDQLPRKTRERVEAATRQIHSELERARAFRAQTERDLAEYRRRYDLTRLPDLRSAIERRNFLRAALSLALFQAIINTLFFAQGATYGVAAGLVAAAVLGFADILFHGLGGRGASLVRAPSWLEKAAGGTMLLLLAASIPVWNLGIVHLRNGVRMHGFEAGTEQWLPNLMASPLGFADFGSWALLILGALCSGSAAITGWAWDEPIPRFRKLGRRLAEAEDDIEDLTEELATVREEAEAERASAEEDLRSRIAHNLHMVDAVVRDIDAIHDNLVAHVADARHAFQALIQFYRDENLLARAGVAPPPAYFQSSPEFDPSLPQDLQADLDEMRAFARRQYEIAARAGIGDGAGNGPAGPTRPAGPKGPTGPAGPTGGRP